MAQTSERQATEGMTCSVKPIVTVSLIENGQVLYVELKDGPDSESGLFLPNDILKQGEDPYEGARRVAKEQAGVSIQRPNLIDVDSFEGNDGTWHLALHFRADVANRSALAAGKSVSQFRWSAASALPPDSNVAHRGWYNSIAQRALQHRTG
jgi:ADP-ribose pyrophosphatase YjhB (NUDIX family)